MTESVEQRKGFSTLMEHSADLVVIGGGLGGVAAALAAARHGNTVIMTEETDWIGGQLPNGASSHTTSRKVRPSVPGAGMPSTGTS